MKGIVKLKILELQKLFLTNNFNHDVLILKTNKLYVNVITSELKDILLLRMSERSKMN